LDTAYEKFLRTKIYDEQILHDRIQPLQIHVYNVKGELISFHINCLTNGLFHIKWNTDKRFNTFPPKTAVPLDTLLSRSRHLSMIRNYHTGMKLSGSFTEYDYLIIVHWCVFIQRQSKGLVKFIEKYKTANSQYKIKVVYVNDDNLYN